MSTPIIIPDAITSHQHALETLEELFKYDDFMLSIDNVLDVGCGKGYDMEWWASRTTRDEEMPEPLEIKVTGLDTFDKLELPNEYEPQKEIKYTKVNMEDEFIIDHLEYKKLDTHYDVIWCHDVFHYAINPLKTLENFYNLLTPGGMLCIIIPQTTNIVYHKQDFRSYNGMMYHYTLVNLIHMLALNRFDCKAGFFKKDANSIWLHAIVYKDDRDLDILDPRITTWYDLQELSLLPDSVDKSILRSGYLKQKDLLLPWLNKKWTSYENR